ncbi:MAG: type II toxin-antitoxin system HicB family antitoxin [Chloroflexota bacterium]
MRQVIVYKTLHGDWKAECPSLPGCVCRAPSKNAAIDEIRRAVREYVEELKARNAPIPEDHFEAAIVYV